ncbi:uncharacterized protein LOC143891407 isoform X2 [Tasmannia lanceolata]|uniref:uncharacterized protein LOC143891407 isoform X2 n=1 Tax=Tasmannia lanceolata TaxID=3420 RepID=UPI0040636CF2
MAQAISPGDVAGYLSCIEHLTGTNYGKWKEHLYIALGCMELDCALLIDEPPKDSTTSTPEAKALRAKWERSNRMSLMIMKSTISTSIRGAIPDTKDKKELTAKEYLAAIEEQFKGTSKALASILLMQMLTLRYDKQSGVREYIMKMSDMASQLKKIEIEISKGFLVHFIMTSLPVQFGPFEINYNTQKEKWTMGESITMCVQEEERLKAERQDSAHYIALGLTKTNFNKKGKNGGNKGKKGKPADGTTPQGKLGCHFCRKR